MKIHYLGNLNQGWLYPVFAYARKLPFTVLLAAYANSLSEAIKNVRKDYSGPGFVYLDDYIAVFLRARAFGQVSSRIRAILVEFTKFVQDRAAGRASPAQETA